MAESHVPWLAGPLPARGTDSWRELEEKFQIAFENAPVGMSIIRPDGRYLSVNSALCQMFGYGADELLSGTLQRITHPDDVEPGNRWIRRVIAGDLSVPEFEKRFLHRDGHVVWGVVRARWIRGQDGEARFAVVHIQDITERKQAELARAEVEAQLQWAQRMEVVGQLAGGVAHDFNNLLTVIGGNTALALEEPGLDQGLRDLLQEVQKAASSATSLTRQLLAFSRKQVIAPRVLDLNELVLHLQRMLQRLLGEDLTLAAQLEPRLGRVRVDPGQVEQILVNLAVNARDAMTGGGRLTLATSNADVRAEASASRAARAVGGGLPPPGAYVALAVTDTGSGMSADTLAHIFEPFFTTKGPGKGTGLGLAMVYGAVRQNEGYVEVESEPGRGTTFRIFLPRVDQPPEAWTEPALPGAGGAETIALVEDEAQVRSFAAGVLRRLGYAVLAYASPAEALADLATLSRAHLLVTDVVLPGMSGQALAAALVTRAPGLAVLFTSGHAENVIARQGVLERGIEFLAKPYSPAELAARVRAVLDGRGRGAGTYVPL